MVALLSFLFSITSVLASESTGSVIVANRAGSSISVYDMETVTTYDLAGSEPMYVVSTYDNQWVIVGDRSNDQVLVLDPRADYALYKTIPCGAGVFHMWASETQLWVNNDIGQSITVIDLAQLSVIGTITAPQDLVSGGYKPHDIVGDVNGQNWFVTFLGGGDGVVVKYDGATRVETARATVLPDPHVSMDSNDPTYPWLVVASQGGGGKVVLLSKADLSKGQEFDISNAHGLFSVSAQGVLYVTNIAGTPPGLFKIDLTTSTVLPGVPTSFPAPHNIVLSADRQMGFITHSGSTQDKVSMFKASSEAAGFTLTGTFTVGANPFGLAFRAADDCGGICGSNTQCGTDNKCFGSCDNDNNCCQQGSQCGASSNQVARCVCQFDAYCCNTAWDNQCVEEAQLVCGLVCA